MNMRPLQDQVTEIAVFGLFILLLGFITKTMRDAMAGAIGNTKDPALLPATASKRVSETLTVERRGSTLVGAMAWETPLVIFRTENNRRYRWISTTIEDWETGLWPKWDKRRGQRFKLQRGSRVQVTALVRPDGETLYRVNLSEPLDAQPGLVLQTQPESTYKEQIQQVIESLQKAIDETRKADSLRRIERILDSIEEEVEYRMVGVDDLRIAIEEYKEVSREGLTPEEYREEKEAAFEAILEAVKELDGEEEDLEEEEKVEYGEALKGITEQYGQWATRLAAAVCPYKDIACIEREARRLVQSLNR